jgi:membrane fusion protein, multidrug efflux system
VNPAALLVPQVGVTRDQKGQPVVLVVNAEKKVERRQVVADRAVGTSWLVTDGIQPGEQVIVEGIQKVRPGALVNPVPASGVK